MLHGLSRRSFALLMVSAAVVSGCGWGSSRPRTVPVSGVLTLDGKAVAGARVRFVPSGEVGRTAIGDTDDSGKFSLSTFEPGDGIIPGEYDADVTGHMAPPANPVVTGDIAAKVAAERPPEGSVPEKYMDAKKSGLHYTFTDEDSGRVVDVKLTK